MTRHAGFLAVAAAALAVAAYAIAAYGLMPIGTLVHPQMRATFAAYPLGIYAHVFGAAVALALGPFQFSSRLRAGYPRLHRTLGRVYLGVGVSIGGLAGLFMAAHAFGGPAARSGFACLAAVWLYSGYRAYRAIRAGDVPAHRRWMTRNFALTFAAVTLRLYLGGSMASGIPFALAYPPIAWLCWLPNLAVAELLVRRGSGPAGRRRGPRAAPSSPGPSPDPGGSAGQR